MRESQNGPAIRPGFVVTPQSTCPINSGYIGFWLDSSDSVLKRRNADGTDSLAGPADAKLISVAALQASNLAGTYNNGTAGAGATLTKASNGALPSVDGYTASVGDLLLLVGQSTAAQNGLYSVTALGASGGGGSPWVLTRSTLFDVSAKQKVGTLFVMQNGTTYGSDVYEFTGSNTYAQPAFVLGGVLTGTPTTAAFASNAVTGPALSAGSIRVLTSVGHNTAGACTLTGAKIGDTVIGISNVTDHTTLLPTTDFEATITVNDQIQQVNSGNLSAKTIIVFLVAKS